MACIYKITNKKNGKIYVGQTYSTTKHRWRTHLNAWRGNRHCAALCSAFDKYGIDNFEIEEIEQCEKDQLNDREQYWIKYYNSYENGYNLTRGGDGHILLDYDLIYNLWDEGLTSTEIGEIIGATQRGVCQALKGYSNYSIEEAVHRGAKRGGITKGKPIQQYSLDGTYMNTFPNATVAAESLGTGMGRAESNNIRACANGRRKSAYGYKWEFVNKEDLHK